MGRWTRFGKSTGGWPMMAMAIAMVLAVGACSADAASDGGADPGMRDAAPTTAPTSPQSQDSRPESPRDLAVDAYLGMWRAMAEAARTSDWKSPELPKYTTGDALSVISRSLYADHYNGLVTKGRPENHPRVKSVKPEEAPTTVMIKDCGDDSNWLKYRKKDGELADDKPGGPADITAEVKKQRDGSWKVTRFALWGVDSC